MSATDKLRHMLDELGVKYVAKDRPMADHSDWRAWMQGNTHQPSGAMRRETLWSTSTDGEQNAYNAKATETDGKLSLEVTYVTPEQALAATLESINVAELRAEHHRVCKELKYLQNGYGSMSREHSQTIIELSEAYDKIDELQTLVEDMLDYLEIQEAFDEPPTSKVCKEFAQRANKLGIEVNDE